MLTKPLFAALAAAVSIAAAAKSYPSPDIFDAWFTNTDGVSSCYDHSPMHMTDIEVNGDIQVKYNAALGRNTATMLNTWCSNGYVPKNWVKVRYKDRQDFMDSLKAGHTIESTFRVIDPPAEYPVQAKMFASQDYGGTGLEFLGDGQMQFSLTTDVANTSGEWDDYCMARTGVRAVPDTYYQLVGIWDAEHNIAKVYLNGKLMGTARTAGELTFPATDNVKWFGIGVDPMGDTKGRELPQFAGSWEIVTARLWSRALTDDEVQGLYEDIVTPQNLIKVASISNATVHNDEANPTDLTALKVTVDWQRPTGFDTGLYEIKGYDLRFDYNKGQYIYDMSVTDPGIEANPDGHFTADFEGLAAGVTAIAPGDVHVALVSDYQLLSFGGERVKGFPTNLVTTPDYAAGIGEMDVRTFKDYTNDLWRVDIDFDRALLTECPEPVSYFTLQYKPGGTGEWIDIPDLRVLMGRRVDHPDTSTVPGTYRFGSEGKGTDKAYVLADHNNAVPAVAYHLTDKNPEGNLYRATAVYGATNDKIIKTAAVDGKAATATLTGITDVNADCQSTTKYYNLQGQPVDPRHGGIYVTSDGHKITL